MTRLIDQINRKGIQLPADRMEYALQMELAGVASKVLNGFRNKILDAVSVDISNVVKYYAESPQYNLVDITEDFWGVTPPWQNAFYEWAQPTRVIDQRGEHAFPAGIREGVLVEVIDLYADHGPEEAALYAPQRWLALGQRITGGQIHPSELARAGGLKVDEPWRWLVTMARFITMRGYPHVYGPTAGMACAITAEGRVGHRVTGDGAIFHTPYSGSFVEESLEVTRNHLMAPIIYVTLANMFANAKGITITENPPAEKLNRAAVRRYKKPLHTYYTLEIDALKRVLKSEGQQDTVGLGKALHLCRGHFAHYTEDKPLFGHFVGTVWKPAHMRGKPERGTVTKDYQLNAPEGS